MNLNSIYGVHVYWLTEPFTADFFLRALLGGALVAVICGVVGTWVVIRGMAFLGEAISHGMLPGVALATVAGAPAIVGGAVSAIVMSALISALQRRGRLSYDTSIGLVVRCDAIPRRHHCLPLAIFRHRRDGHAFRRHPRYEQG